jgi:transposase
MAPGKKNAEDLGAHIVFLDESGFMLISTVCKTWAPRGQTPIHHHHERHDRISVISGISMSPIKNRLGLYYSLHEGNITKFEVREFLRYLLQHLRGHVIVIWDNGRPHKGDVIRELCRKYKRLHLEAFPPYCPSLNPDEGIWAQAKRSLANGRPDNLLELWWHLLDVLDVLTFSHHLLKACINHSELPLFLP